MKSLIVPLVLALVAGQAGSAAPAPAQTNSGSIAGRVIDPDGGVVPGVAVMVSSAVLPTARSLVTGARGDFAIADLAPGSYELRLSLTGFKTANGQVNVLSGRRSSIGFSLQLGSLSETVTISGIASGTQPPAVVAPAAVAGAPQVPIRVGGDIQEPRRLRDVRPVYPAGALAAGISGTVIIEAVISRDGTVANATVVQGVPELDAAALAAVRQWLYRPTMLNGQPVAVVVNVTMTFVVR
jgi:TonB family protein